ncbi:9902_t:CDS:1, partial [Racocetra persica]
FSQLLPTSCHSTFNYPSLYLPYNLTNKSNDPLTIQIDFREILALIHIHNTITSQSTVLLQPQIILPSYEVQLIQQFVHTPTYQKHLIDLNLLITQLDTNKLHFYTDGSIKNL